MNSHILRFAIAYVILLVPGIFDLNAETGNRPDSTDRYFTFQISDKTRPERVEAVS